MIKLAVEPALTDLPQSKFCNILQNYLGGEISCKQQLPQRCFPENPQIHLRGEFFDIPLSSTTAFPL